MTFVHVSDVTVQNTSLAVAVGRAVIDALATAEQVHIDADASDIDEPGLKEMTAYLERRGVAVQYDHDAGFPVATKR